MNSFHVSGIVFAAWALLVSFLGITREDFPGSRGVAAVVGTISVLLALTAVGTGIYTSATEDHGGEEEHEEAAALVLPR